MIVLSPKRRMNVIGKQMVQMVLQISAFSFPLEGLPKSAGGAPIQEGSMRLLMSCRISKISLYPRIAVLSVWELLDPGKFSSTPLWNVISPVQN
jgi:hypothetical protein